MIESIFSVLGGGTAVWALAKLLLKNHFDKQVIEFQKTIEQQNALKLAEHKMKYEQELDNFRSKLEIDRITYQIKFGGIYKQQAKGVLELYNELDRFISTTEFYDQYQNEVSLEEFIDSCVDFQRCFAKNKIFLSPKADALFSSFYNKHTEIINNITEFNIKRRKNTDDISDKVYNFVLESDTKKETMSLIKDLGDLKSMKKDLIDEFRKIIGIVDDKKKK